MFSNRIVASSGIALLLSAFAGCGGSGSSDAPATPPDVDGGTRSPERPRPDGSGMDQAAAWWIAELAGAGPTDFKGVMLRWTHGADGVEDPGAANLTVFAIQMIYVPQCAFWAGDGTTNTTPGQFPVGDTDLTRQHHGYIHLVTGQFLEPMQHLGVVAAKLIHDRTEHRDHIVEVIPIIRVRVWLAGKFRLVTRFLVAPVFVIEIRRFDFYAHNCPP